MSKVSNTLGICAALLLLAGCSSAPAVITPPPAPVVTFTPPPGPQTFISWVRGSTYGTKDMNSATDDQILTIGNDVCGMAATATSLAEVIQGLTAGAPTVEESTNMVRHSVTNLCPQYKMLLP